MTGNSECLGCRLSNQLEPVNIVYENEYIWYKFSLSPLKLNLLFKPTTGALIEEGLTLFVWTIKLRVLP